MLYNAHFFFCNNSAPSVTIAINSFTGNWTYEQDCLYLWKFVSWMFVNRRASVYCFVYCIILHYTHITLIFSNIPHVTLWYIFQSPARIVLYFSVSFFTFLSAFSSADVEEKSMNYETGYFHHHTVQSFSFSIDTERWCQFSEKFSVNCLDHYDLGVYRGKVKGLDNICFNFWQKWGSSSPPPHPDWVWNPFGPLSNTNQEQ